MSGIEHCRGRQMHCTILSPNFYTFKEPKNWFHGTNSGRLCSLAGRYDKPIPKSFLAPIDCLKIPTLLTLNYSAQCTHIWAPSAPCCTATGSPNISVTMSPSPSLQGNIWEIFPNPERWEECGDNARDKLTHTHTHTRTVHPRTSHKHTPPYKVQYSSAFFATFTLLRMSKVTFFRDP